MRSLWKVGGGWKYFGMGIDWELGNWIYAPVYFFVIIIIVIAVSYREWKKLVVTSSPRSLYLYMKQYGMLIKMAKKVAKIISLRATSCLQNLGDLRRGMLWELNLVKLFQLSKTSFFC